MGGRLPQELRLRGVKTIEAANGFLRQEYRADSTGAFAVAAAGKGSAFVRTRRKYLDWVFSIQQERTVKWGQHDPDWIIAFCRLKKRACGIR